jgi:rhodanese-related sulfurtransferase
MSTTCELSFQQKSLFQQGYQQYSAHELSQLEWGLRFTPAVCSSITAYGLYTQQPYVLFFVGILGMWAFFFPAGHPMDLIYNRVVRHAFKAIELPENPFQRRLACFAAGVMNTAAAILFLTGLPVAAIAVGVTLLILQVIVITTHFCTLSWMYEGIMRMLGKWKVPVDLGKAKTMVENGAMVVDVRSQSEFASESIECTVNLPLENLDGNTEKFKDQTALIFCNSGTRSHIAVEKLKLHGFKNVFNLGSFTRAKELMAPFVALQSRERDGGEGHLYFAKNTHA